MVCAIWGTITIDEQPGGGDYSIVDSPRAGGRYRITDSARKLVEYVDDETKIKLTDFIVDQNKIGQIAVIDSKAISRAENWILLDVNQRADRVLEWYNDRSKKIGDIVELLLSDNKEDEGFLSFLAWSSATTFEEIRYLLDYLCNSLSYLDKQAITGAYRCCITPKGYTYLRNLNAQNLDTKQVFVAMWFAEDMKTIYDDGIEPAIREAGYEPLRIDRKEHVNKIDDEIIADIRKSKFLIADFTSEKEKPRGGVYYEAGFAHGLNKPVVWCCKEDQIDDVHFDTRQYNHIVWKNAEDLRNKLKNRILAVIGEGPLKQDIAN